MMKRILVVMAVSLSTLVQAQVFGPVPPKDVATMTDMIGTTLRAKPAAPRKVLVYTYAYGYAHHDAMAYACRAFEIASLKTDAFKVDFTCNGRCLRDSKMLEKYDALVLNNCTGVSEKTFPGIGKTLTEYVKSGKGLCVIHAGADSFYDCDAVADMIGGRFWGHPWYASGKWSFTNEQPDLAVNAAFKDLPRVFTTSDEIYQQSSPAYARDKVTVLISLNMKDQTNTAAVAKWRKQRGDTTVRTDGDFAVAWVRDYGKGRVFYTSFGHDRRTFVDPVRLHSILDGLQYVLRDL